MLATTKQVRDEGNLPDTITNETLLPHLTKAVIEVKKILTPGFYSSVEVAGLDDPADDSFVACSIAEANLAIYYAIPSLNMETQGSGIVRTKGWDQSRSDLLSQNEVQTLRQTFYDTAMDLLQPYIPQELAKPGDWHTGEVKGSNFRLSAI